MKIYHWAFTIILTLKVSSFVLLCLVSFSCVCVCVFFFVSCHIGYMEQPGRVSLAQSRNCAHGCSRSKSASRQERALRRHILNGGQERKQKKKENHTMLVLPGIAAKIATDRHRNR